MFYAIKAGMFHVEHTCFCVFFVPRGTFDKNYGLILKLFYVEHRVDVIFMFHVELFYEIPMRNLTCIMYHAIMMV
jgi:hypothetical protein